MFITPSFKKSLIVEQFQGNYLKRVLRVFLVRVSLSSASKFDQPCAFSSANEKEFFSASNKFELSFKKIKSLDVVK